VNRVASIEDRHFDIHVASNDEVRVDEERHVASIENIGAPSLYSLILDNSSYEVHVEERDGSYRVLLLGELYTVQLEDEAVRQVARGRRPLDEGEVTIKSPIPGLVFDVPVAIGQRVQSGDILVIVEAMKMENELRAPRDGEVKIIYVSSGDSVEKGKVLLTLL
jgi:biotin carboxyl carrier protein